MTRHRLAALAASLLLAACAPSGDYPSLAPRAIEGRATFAEPVREPAIAPAADPASAAKVAAVLAALATAEHDFDAALAAVRRLPARPPTGSEVWVAAQQALTVLDAARQPATAALADLEALRLAAAEGPRAVDTAALDAAYARATALADAQRAAYDAEAARFPAG